jgi:hypothetical protein
MGSEKLKLTRGNVWLNIDVQGKHRCELGLLALDLLVQAESDPTTERTTMRPSLHLTRSLFLVLLLVFGLMAGCSDIGPGNPEQLPAAEWTTEDPLDDVLKSTDGFTPHSPEDRIARLTEVLGLTEDQAAAFLAAYLEFRAGMDVLREQVQAGELTREEAHEAALPLREAFEAELQIILTAEQYDLLQELRLEHEGGQGGDHEGGPGDGHHGGGDGDYEARWSDWLATIGADQAQTDTIMAAVEAMHEGVRAVREAFRAGEITREEARAQTQVLRDDLDALLQETLTEEQYAALLELRPDCGGRRR